MSNFMAFFIKHKKKLVIALDILLIPIMILCRLSTDGMLSQDHPCPWTYVGAQCGSCGGTRCVNHFFSGDIIGAFQLNPFVVICIFYLIFTVVLLNLLVFTKLTWPEKVLRKMYGIPALIISLSGYFLFTILRNIPWFIAFFTVLSRVQ